MAFIDFLKRKFIYTGQDDVTPIDTEKIQQEAKENKKERNIKIRAGCILNTDNPIGRYKNIISDCIKTGYSHLKEDTTFNKIQISKVTKDCIYLSLYVYSESKEQLNKPFEEVKLLFKKFLEDELVDDSYYSKEDLKYINSSVELVRNLRNTDTSNLKLKDEIDKFINSIYFFNKLELLELYYGYNILSSVCEKSYILCGYKYNSNDHDIFKEAVNRNLCFLIELDVMSFYLQSEVKSLISNEDDMEKKKAYIEAKIVHLVESFIINSSIPLKCIHNINKIFSYIEDTENLIIKDETHKEVVENKDTSLDEIEAQKAILNPIEILREKEKEVCKTDTLQDSEVRSIIFNKSTPITSDTYKDNRPSLEEAISIYKECLSLTEGRNLGFAIDSILDTIKKYIQEQGGDV